MYPRLADMVISCHCRICPISVCTHFVECPCQAVAQQGIVKLHLYQHGIHGGGQSFQFQRFVLLRKHQPSLCHAPVWKVQTIGVMVHLRIFVFISDLFGIYNQFPFFRLMRGAEQSIMFPICSTKLLKLSGSPP